MALFIPQTSNNKKHRFTGECVDTSGYGVEMLRRGLGQMSSLCSASGSGVFHVQRVCVGSIAVSWICYRFAMAGSRTSGSYVSYFLCVSSG